MNDYRFTVYGQPIPCSRPRVTRGGTHTYHMPRYAAWLALVQVAALQAHGRPMLEGSVGLAVTFHGARLNGDLDNLVKGVKDGMTGIIYRDDVQIEELFAQKLPVVNWRDRRAEVRVWRLE